MIRLLLAASIACTGGMAGAAERISAFDLLIDGKIHKGRQVLVHGCTVIGASASILMCNVRARPERVERLGHS